MMKSFIFSMILCLSVSFAQVIGPKVSLQQMEHDFGEIVQGTRVSHNFILTNTGGDILEINDVRASCGCTAAEPDKKNLKPGESTKIKVEFNSAGRKGKQEKIVYVSTNDPENKELQLKIRGEVVDKKSDQSSVSPKIYFPETSHNFGKISEGKVVDYTFKFVNAGSSTLQIKDVKTSCGCTAALVSKNSIEPGEEGTLKVQLNTAKRKGKMNRKVTVISNDPKEPNKLLTVQADIIRESN